MALKKDSNKIKNQPSVPARITGPRNLQNVTGIKDRIGIDRKWWQYFQEVAFEIAHKYNFHLVHPASIEYTTNYTRSLKKEHPLVQDNLFTLLDPNQEHISLRPCFDISYLRAYYLLHKHKFDDSTQTTPIENWYTIGSVFGNKFEPREKIELLFSVLGNDHPVVDAELTIAAFKFLRGLGFENMQVLINSIGGEQSQEQYLHELAGYFKEKRKDLCTDCQALVSKNPMKILSCEKQECQYVLPEAPQSVDWLIEEDKEHFVRVLEYLDELEIPYMLSHELAPDNDYHQKTIIAIKLTTEDTSYILAKGGRYDGLSKLLTDHEFGAVKMLIDLDKCITAVRGLQMKIPKERLPQIFIAQLGEAAKKKALSIREELHAAGISTYEHYGRDSLRLQLEQAVKLGVKYTCILGQKEILEGTILVRDMDGGIQEAVPIDKLVMELKKRL